MRAREAVSSRLDGELSELEVARLDVHLRRCAACREFAAAAEGIVTELRRAPLERVAAPAFEPRRRRTVSVLRVQATAVAAVAAVAALGVAGMLRSSSPSSGPAVPAVSVGPTLQEDIRSQHIVGLTADFFPSSPLRAGNIYAA